MARIAAWPTPTSAAGRRRLFASTSDNGRTSVLG